MTVALAAVSPIAAGSVERRLRAVRRRLWAQSFVAFYGVFLLLTAGVLLVWGAVRFLLDRPVWEWIFVVVLLGVPLVFAGVCTFGLNRSVRSLQQAAWRIDRLARTHDRFHTAFAFVGRDAGGTSMEALALDECTRFIETFDFRPAIPVRVPRAAWYTVFPLIALAMLAIYVALGIGQPQRDPALDAAVNRRADTLEKIADRLRRDPRASQPELDKIADEMKRSADRLKAGEHQTDEDRLKSALKEISSLEAMLNAMKQAKQDGKISPGELSALAAALAAAEQSRDAAELLKSGKLEQAAGQLEQLLQQLKQQGNSSQALQQLAQSMQEQAAKLSEQEKNEMARQMQQAAQGAQSGQPQLSQQALQRLADLLRRAGQNGQGKDSSQQQQASNGKGGQPMTEKQLQDLINALENMKDGLRPGDGKSPGQPQDGQGDGQQSLAMVESFSQNPSGNPNPGQNPTGMPGSERDPRPSRQALRRKTRRPREAKQRQTPRRFARRRRISPGTHRRRWRQSGEGGATLQGTLRRDGPRRAGNRRTGRHSARLAFLYQTLFRKHPAKGMKATVASYGAASQGAYLQYFCHPEASSASRRTSPAWYSLPFLFWASARWGAGVYPAARSFGSQNSPQDDKLSRSSALSHATHKT